MPFEKLVEELAPERDLSRSPHSSLFQAKFVLQTLPQAAISSLRLTPWETSQESSILDMTLAVTESDGLVLGAFDYATELFDPETVERMANHYSQLLSLVAAKPERSLWEYDLATQSGPVEISAGLAPAERRDFEPVQIMFENQAARTPDAIAIVCEDRCLSYAEADRAVNRLAHYLRNAGVCPEMLVALCMDRSEEVVIAMLAVLKGGGAYLPMDPSHPTERLGFLIEDSAAAIVVTDKFSRGHLPAAWTTMIDVDSDRSPHCYATK